MLAAPAARTIPIDVIATQPRYIACASNGRGRLGKEPDDREPWGRTYFRWVLPVGSGQGSGKRTCRWARSGASTTPRITPRRKISWAPDPTRPNVTLMPMCGLSPLETMIQQQPAITCH